MSFVPSPIVGRIAELLIARGETVAVAESSTGGLISASLLAVPGASAYYLGGAVVYTLASRVFVWGEVEPPEGMRGATETFAEFLAQSVQAKLGATWALAETGATGPSGNRYGDAAGHSCLAVWGPQRRTITLETGSDDRVANMAAFTEAGLGLLETVLATAPR